MCQCRRSATPRTQSTSTPASTIPSRLIASWAADSAAMSQSPTVAATTAKPAAGTVVTEMKTPTRAADLAETSDSIPAAPANSATTNDSGPTWKMKSTSSNSLSAGDLDPADRLARQHSERGDQHGDGESDQQRQRRAAGQVCLAAHQRDRQCGQRAEFRPNHHRTDHRHGRVGDDADRGDQARQAQECQESDVERGLLARSPGQFVPDHGVGGVSRSLLLSPVGTRRQDGVDDVQRDRPAFLDAKRLQRIDDLVRGLAGDVGGDLVAHRVPRGVAVYDEMRDAGVVGQGVDHRIAEFSGCDDP